MPAVNHVYITVTNEYTCHEFVHRILKIDTKYYHNTHDAVSGHALLWSPKTGSFGTGVFCGSLLGWKERKTMKASKLSDA